MDVKLENEDILNGISALGKILDKSSPCKVCIEAVYSRTLDKKKITLQLPIINVVPMYIENCFAAK